jgi:hypothetical protein
MIIVATNKSLFAILIVIYTLLDAANLIDDNSWIGAPGSDG